MLQMPYRNSTRGHHARHARRQAEKEEGGVKPRQVTCTQCAVGCLLKHAGLTHHPAPAEL